MREGLLDGTHDAGIDQDAGLEVRHAVEALRAFADGDRGHRPDPVRIDIRLRDNLP